MFPIDDPTPVPSAEPELIVPSSQPLLQQEPAAPPARRHRKRNTILLLIGGALLGICACIGLVTMLSGTALAGVALQQKDVLKIVDNYMITMSRKDSDQAYALFSSRARRQFPLNKLKDLLTGDNFACFDGYQKAKITNINIGPAINTNPDVPQGTVARISGMIDYEGGFSGKFDAVLDLENQVWMLHLINVTVPPEKLNDFKQKAPQG